MSFCYKTLRYEYSFLRFKHTFTLYLYFRRVLETWMSVVVYDAGGQLTYFDFSTRAGAGVECTLMRLRIFCNRPKTEIAKKKWLTATDKDSTLIIETYLFVERLLVGKLSCSLWNDSTFLDRWKNQIVYIYQFVLLFVFFSAQIFAVLM